jgi:hypothetical protein
MLREKTPFTISQAAPRAPPVFFGRELGTAAPTRRHESGVMIALSARHMRRSVSVRPDINRDDADKPPQTLTCLTDEQRIAAITIAQNAATELSIKPITAVNNCCTCRCCLDGAISCGSRYNFIFSRGFNPTEAFMTSS